MALFSLDAASMKTAVGYDNRHHAQEYTQAFITGLNDSGINTINIGLSMSQIVYYSSYEFKPRRSNDYRFS